ncbi:MAG: indole-3-glycerol phosphate synthase TrpC [Candidatus Omnitrophica bacterium]|nr:indole-3-glycerol phosphate synthase TrpC [Candidatus Omnitrophota bacterium]
MKRDFLKEIVAYKRELLEQKSGYYGALKKNVKTTPHSRYGLFKKAISNPGRVNLIAEIKKASPSVGIIREPFDLNGLARTYKENGAAAISVLTEDKYFLGKPTYVRRVCEEVAMPVLTKDFIIDEHQIYETFCQGSSAVLLIVAILDDALLKDLMQIAADLDMDSLVEVHDEAELQRALKVGADIIGINHRNLATLAIDLSVSEKLVSQIPRGKVIVAESGIKTNEEIKQLQSLGVHAVLIGESFLRSADVGAKVREIMGVK